MFLNPFQQWLYDSEIHLFTLRTTQSYTLLHFVVCNESQSARPELIWTALIGHCIKSSTASSVIGYSAQSCKHASVSGSVQPANADLNLAAGDLTHCFFNHVRYNVIVSNTANVNIFCLLKAAFKFHLAQKSEGARAPMGMTSLPESRGNSITQSFWHDFQFFFYDFLWIIICESNAMTYFKVIYLMQSSLCTIFKVIEGFYLFSL